MNSTNGQNGKQKVPIMSNEVHTLSIARATKVTGLFIATNCCTRIYAYELQSMVSILT